MKVSLQIVWYQSELNHHNIEDDVAFIDGKMCAMKFGKLRKALKNT